MTAPQVMAAPYQKQVIVGIWAVTLADAVRQGVSLPTFFSLHFDKAFPHVTFNWTTVVFGLLAPPFLILFQGLFRKIFPKPSRARLGLITQWVDSRWGHGSTDLFFQSLRPMALMACAGVVLGAVGWMSCVYTDATPMAFVIASFFLSAGVGFGLARVLAIRFFPD